jgi:hypothetical protein
MGLRSRKFFEKKLIRRIHTPASLPTPAVGRAGMMISLHFKIQCRKEKIVCEVWSSRLFYLTTESPEKRITEITEYFLCATVKTSVSSVVNLLSSLQKASNKEG